MEPTGELQPTGSLPQPPPGDGGEPAAAASPPAPTAADSPPQASAGEPADGSSGSSRFAPAPLLLVTTVDIGDGKADRIEVRLGDAPLQVATAFVTKHALPSAVIQRLAMHLEENLLKVEEARRGADAHDDEMDGEGLEVFHRLYHQALTLRQKMDMRREMVKRSELQELASSKMSMSWISSEMMRERSAGPFDNYGEMLYAESLESLARKHERAERARAEREEQEVEGATFHPEISRAAQEVWAGTTDCGAVPAWKRLSKAKVTKAQERLNMLRRERAEAEVAECTFKPAISGRSERLMTERSQTLRSMNVSAHQQLYQDAIRRQQKQQDYQHWYPEEVTFQPKLNESAMSREFLRKSLQKEAGGGEGRGPEVVHRLYASYEKLQNKLAEARSTLQNSVDPATGRRLFHPETGRGPRFSRNAGQQPVCEYLYSLSYVQEEKLRAATQEKERRRHEEATCSKAAHGSKALVRALQHKRFRQIFDFLDADGLGAVDVVAVIGAAPEWLDDLDDEVRADLEAAARLLSRRALKHTDSAGSNASSAIFMPPPPGDAESAAGSPSRGGGASPGPSSPAGARAAAGPIAFSAFCAVMEEVLASRRGPRAYLAPSPPRKQLPEDSHQPQICQRSKMLASRVRPKDVPAYEALYAEGSAIREKLSGKRAEAEAAAAKELTFAPKLLSKQLVKEGRVMKAVREGTWWSKPAADGGAAADGGLDSAASLQDLASCIMAGEQQQGAPGAGGSPGKAGFSSSEEQAQYFELEREVAEMQAMLEEATAAAAVEAAAGGDASKTNTQYLTEILGLAQEQVDALAPAMSALQSLEQPAPAAGDAKQGSVAAAMAALAALGGSAAAAAATPTRSRSSSFRVTEEAAGARSGEAAAGAAGSVSGASPGQLSFAVKEALQELGGGKAGRAAAGSDASFISRTLGKQAGSPSDALLSSRRSGSSAALSSGLNAIEGADLFELAAGGGGAAADASLEELAAAVNASMLSSR